MEIWKAIENSNHYEVSNKGRIRSLNYLGHGKTQVLALAKDQKGYMRVRLYFGKYRKTCKVHRLVASAFLDNPDNLPEVNHKDGNKENNCVTNLEWSTSRDNTLHAYQHGLKEKVRDHARKMGSTVGKAALARERERRKIPVIATNIITGEELEFESATFAAKELGLQQANVWKALNGQRKSTGGYAFRERR